MTKTTNYQLNQWDPDDRILRVDFNADNTAIDAALKANADAIASETTNRKSADTKLRTDFAAADTAIRTDFTAADTAIRSEFAAADTTIKKSVSTETTNRKNADTAIRTDFAAADEVLRSENMVVKLFETTTTELATQVNVTVSGLDLADYREVIIIPEIIVSSGNYCVGMRVNGLSTSIYQFNGSAASYLSFFYPFSGHSTEKNCAHTRLELSLGGTLLRGQMFSGSGGRAAVHQGFCILSGDLAPSAVKTFNFFSCNPGNLGTAVKAIAAGSRIKIYGVK